MKEMSCNGDFMVPKGYGFHPTDEQLLSDLEEKNQCKEESQITPIIPEIDVCKHEPRELPELAFRRAEILKRKFCHLFYIWFAKAESWESQRKWYFFTPRKYKYRNSPRSNRTTREGFWKITGKDRAIKAPGSKAVIGMKRTMTFHQRGEGKSQKTGWVIHEYYLIQAQSDPPKQIGDFVVCCLKYKSDNSGHDKDAPYCNRGRSSCIMASNVENQAEENGVNVETIPNGNDSEAENGVGMITETDEYETLKQLADELEVSFANETDPCRITETDEYETLKQLADELEVSFANETDPCRITEGPPDRSNWSDMAEMLLHNPENLDPLLYAPAPPQLHQPDQSPMCTTNGESRKRTCPFEDNNPSLLKNNISINADDNLVGNSASSSGNQAANVIPEGADLGSDFGSFPPKDHDYTQPSINGGPRDFSHDNNFIEWDDLTPLYEGIDSFLVPHTVIDGGSGVTSDENNYLQRSSWIGILHSTGAMLQFS